MENGSWLGNVGIQQIHIGDGKMHDGYVDVHLGITFSRTGAQRLGRHLTAKVKSIDSVVATDKTLKFVAKPNSDGSKMNEGDLKLMTNRGIRSLKAWASKLSAGDIAFCTSSGLSEDRIIAAMAVPSAPTGDIEG